MASSVGSTEASTRDRRNQDGVNLAATMIIQMLIHDPWQPVEEILDFVTWIGPARTVQELMQMFGGRRNLQLTLERLEIIRQARRQDTMSLLPIDAEPFNGTLPEIDGNIHLWAPRVIGGEPPFRYPPPGETMQGGPLNRYPHEGAYTDDFWEEQESDDELSMAGVELYTGSEGEEDEDPNLARPEARD